MLYILEDLKCRFFFENTYVAILKENSYKSRQFVSHITTAKKQIGALMAADLGLLVSHLVHAKNQIAALMAVDLGLLGLLVLHLANAKKQIGALMAADLVLLVSQLGSQLGS
jgi:hypothetical protein